MLVTAENRERSSRKTEILFIFSPQQASKTVEAHFDAVHPHWMLAVFDLGRNQGREKP
jgi:hypothetical protein